MRLITLSAIAMAAMMSASAQTTISVDVSKEAGRIPSLIYGAGAEDVNHEIYGGLYDQRIFGESFEEPSVSDVEGFTAFDSNWNVDDNVLSISTSSHGKIVLDKIASTPQKLQVEVRPDALSAIAGIIVDVADASAGADSFRGYEISLNPSKKVLVVGKHEHNWQPIAEVPADIAVGKWTLITIERSGKDLKISLDGEPAYTLSDSNPLAAGTIGLRSYGGSASFRNLVADDAPMAFNGRPVGLEGFRHFDASWAVTDAGEITTSTSTYAKLVSNAAPQTKGSVDMELRQIAPAAISGVIFDVQEAGNGADNFRGYEVSLNAGKKALVIGKHDHDWQPIDEVPVNYDPSQWNRLHVDFDGAAFTVSLNGNEVYSYTDENAPLLSGKVGVRTFDGAASFRNLVINGNTVTPAPMAAGVSSMWDAIGHAKFTRFSSGGQHDSSFQRIDGKAGDGIANYGLNKWGINVDSSVPMSGCIYLRGSVPEAVVALQSADGTVEYARANISGITPDKWNKFTFDFNPSASDINARFALLLGADGQLDADMALLHTESFPYRADITEAFRKQGLTFLRYGGTMVNAAEYKTGNMFGPSEERPPYIGHYYRYSTNGFGIIEFVEFARLIGTEPTFAINIEDNPADVLALLKEIEPLGLRYLEIGNEENIGDDSRAAYEHYVERFNVLYDAIHPVYPDLVFINAAWWRADRTDLMEYVFRELDGKSDLWDFHPWTDEVSQARSVESDLKNMQKLFTTWNPATKMHVAILEENGNTHSLHRALSHAVVLNVVRKMNGFVELDSPANALEPYLQNDNGWNQGQIFFTPSQVWGQPPYYAQQMASAYHEPVLLDASVRRGPSLHVSATRSESGDRVVLHIVNSAAKEQKVKIDLAGIETVGAIEGLVLSSASLTDHNTPQEPEKIVPRAFTATEPSLTLEPYSYTVVAINCTSGVSEVAADDAADSTPAAYYNIAGEKVSNPSNGIFITDNGKKVALHN